jgi:hypothetical protein
MTTPDRPGRAVTGTASGDIASPSPLLERERDLPALDNALRDAEAGRGRFVLLEAPAGLGKTSLLDAACAAAAAIGFRPLRARATELERDFAFGCVRQLLEPVVARAAGAEQDRLFQGSAALAEALFAGPERLRVPSSSESAFSVLHGLFWLLDDLPGERPVVLAVDRPGGSRDRSSVETRRIVERTP